ncbi:MAG: LCP family protein [Nocardioidaceae bacterium]
MSSATPSLRGAWSATAGLRSDRVAFRRSLALMLMTLLLPGSAQLVAGHKRVGRIAVRVSLSLLALLLTVVLLAFVHRTWLLALLTSPRLLLGERVLLILLALAWIGLFTDAWRLGNPMRLRRPYRLAMLGVNGTLCLVTGGALLFSAHLVAVQRDFILTVFGSSTVTAPHDGRYNVLLLGGDSGQQRWGLRPDSINLASIDESTGRTVLFSIPRNLENVPFPQGSVMAQQFPHGFNCSGCYINGVYTWARDHPDLFPGVQDPGIVATEQAVEGVTGLQVNYYALVNLAGFTDLVDAVGGVTIDVPKSIPIGGIGGAITGHIPPGVQKLDGYQALWFARSRVADDDYSRMARQKCVMNAMLQQLSPQTVVLKVQAIADASKRLLRTDIPASDLDTFIELALKARSQPVSTVSFVPPTITTYAPDFAKIRSMVTDAIARSQGGAGTTSGHGHAKPKGAKAANQTNNLAATC